MLHKKDISENMKIHCRIVNCFINLKKKKAFRQSENEKKKIGFVNIFLIN